jgi:hypothetical protein
VKQFPREMAGGEHQQRTLAGAARGGWTNVKLSVVVSSKVGLFGARLKRVHRLSAGG